MPRTYSGRTTNQRKIHENLTINLRPVMWNKKYMPVWKYTCRDSNPRPLYPNGKTTGLCCVVTFGCFRWVFRQKYMPVWKYTCRDSNRRPLYPSDHWTVLYVSGGWVRCLRKVFVDLGELELFACCKLRGHQYGSAHVGIRTHDLCIQRQRS